ncbi:MAG: carbohydrate kinase [Marinilabiliaceae bacterium]|nr:carbohydrate kinase [Marinilabiliaceae bacterium]
MIYGIGETVFDILFDTSNKPMTSTPGGSTFNAMISLGRSGRAVSFISEVGDDHIGELTRSFLKANGVDERYVVTRRSMRSPLSLAFIDSAGDAHYTFYKDHAHDAIPMYEIEPRVNEEDVLLFGSFYAINPVLAEQVKYVVEQFYKAGSVIYYDVNFRASHKGELKAVMPNVIYNFEKATIVKGSDEDFGLLLGETDPEKIYKSMFESMGKVFVCTRASKGVELFYGKEHMHVEARDIKPVSTIGAGDSFNAGFLAKFSRSIEDGERCFSMESLEMNVKEGVEYATEVCLSLDNYIAHR